MFLLVVAASRVEGLSSSRTPAAPARVLPGLSLVGDSVRGEAGLQPRCQVRPTGRPLVGVEDEVGAGAARGQTGGAPVSNWWCE